MAEVILDLLSRNKCAYTIWRGKRCYKWYLSNGYLCITSNLPKPNIIDEEDKCPFNYKNIEDGISHGEILATEEEYLVQGIN